MALSVNQASIPFSDGFFSINQVKGVDNLLSKEAQSQRKEGTYVRQ